MKVSYGEGVASHTGSESCVADRKASGEALTRVRAGWVSSHENFYFGVPTAYVLRKATSPASPSQEADGLRGVLDPMHARMHLTRMGS
jgi:hypothetical protein